MGKSYLVEGARLRCLCGSKCSKLKVLFGHGYTAVGKKKASCTDCLAVINIPDFGQCMMNKEGGTCKGFMKLDSKWKNKGGSSWKLEQLNDKTALTMDSFLICKRGGIIAPETSGQGDVQKINWKEYEKRYKPSLLHMLGDSTGCLYGFDPVNLNTGNFIYEKEDLVIHGITELSFQMTYNSMEEFQGGCIGEGWHHNYEISLQHIKKGVLCLCLGDGRRIDFRKNIDKEYIPAYGNPGILKQESEGYRYVMEDGIEYAFDSAGKFISRKNQDGDTDIFLYNIDGMLSEVQGANGGKLYYYYNKEGNLYRVCDHIGREVRLYYSYRVLQKYVNSMGQAYVYDYNENLRLTSVTTPRGILGVYNSYDSVNRVIKQSRPDGSIVELRYDDMGQLTHTKDQKGHVTTYQSDDRFRNIQISSKSGQEKFKYNDNDQIIFYEDQNGNTTRYQYNQKGRLLEVMDALGGRRNFAYDKEGRVTSCMINGKKVLKNEYDEKGHLIKTIDALGSARKLTYDNKGMLKCMVLPDGSSLEICRDEKGNICRLKYPDHTAIRYQYDALNRVTETIDMEDNKISYRYDERDHLTAVMNQEGAVREYFYDENGNLSMIRDYDGGIFSISYDAVGRPERVTDKEGRETKRRYDLAGNLIEEIFPIGAVSRYEYDRENRLVRAKRMAAEDERTAAVVVNYVYDPAGNLLKVEARDGDGRDILAETSYEYDKLNRVVCMTDPIGGKTYYTYDTMSGKISSITDAAGNKSVYRYNDAGELIEKTDVKGNVTKYEYSELGKILSVTDGAGRTVRYHYLPGGKLEQISYPDGNLLSYTYDSLGRVQRKTDVQGYSIAYSYDSMGRVQKIMGKEGQIKSYSYDVMGNVTSVIDALGSRTEYNYTLSGKLREVKDALGNKTEFTYDAADRLIHICQHGQTGEEERDVYFERNVFGQVESIRDASGTEECYSYDPLGRMTAKIDREGFRTVYTYLPDGKIESILYGDGNKAEFQYTPLRQLALIKDWLGETRVERNSYGEPVSITDYRGQTVRYEWGKMGERKKLIYPDGTVVSMHYDELLHPVELTRTAEGKDALWIRYQYDSRGRLFRKHSSGGYRTTIHYNGSGQIEELLHEDADGILDKYHYTYDAAGNRIQIQKQRRNLPEESGSYRFTYDTLQRLTEAEKDGDILRSYHYDSFSNRTSMEDYEQGISSIFTYDVLNRLTNEKNCYNSDKVDEKKDAAASVYYDYDKRGNMTGEYREGDLYRRYVYNAMNRLEKVCNKKGQEAVYFYNGLGYRTEKICNADRESYILDLTKKYNNLLCIKDHCHDQKIYWDHNAAAMDEDGRKTLYFLPDELGSPLRVLRDNGSGSTYGYDEFGRNSYGAELKGLFSERYSKPGEEQPFGYTGYRYDADSETYFAQVRQYRPEIGRFTAEDLIKGNGAYPETLNPYVYCWNNPIKFIDKDGRIGYYFYDPNTFPKSYPGFEEIKEKDIESLEKQYNTEIIPVEMNTESGHNADGTEYTTFENAWNSMEEENGKIDVVVIISHASNERFVTDSSVDAKGEHDPKTRAYRDDIRNLEDKNIGTLYLLGCNMGLTHSEDFGERNSLASTFYEEGYRKSIDKIIAADGSVCHGIDNNGDRILYVKPKELYHPDGVYDGFKEYKMVDGKLEYKIIDDISVYWGRISPKRYEDTDENCKGGKKSGKGKEKGKAKK